MLLFSEDNEVVASQEIEDFSITVFPNPNDGNFTIKLTGEIQPYTVEILNSTGRLLGTVNSQEAVVNINRFNLYAGIYFVKITMKGKTTVKKVIVR